MSIEVRLLGEFELLSEAGTTISLTARKARALLAYLCVRAGRPQQREHLAELLWGDVSKDDYARKSLRQALTVLRRDLPGAFIEATRDEVRVERTFATVDVIEFDHLSRSSNKGELERAIALYRGELLEGFRSRADAFDDWLTSERQRLRERAAAALGRLLELERTLHDLSGATKSAIRLVSLDPLNEQAHRALMQLYAEQGRLGDALDQYENCRGVLERELGHGPEPETVALLTNLRLQRRSHSLEPSAPTESSAQLRVLGLLAIARAERAEAAELAPPALDAAILEHGGSVLRRTSHMTLGVFGARRSQGSEATRALSAALRIQQAIPGAYACGIVYAQAMVTLTDDTLSVVGDAVGQAADLAARADSGAIVISESVRLALRHTSLVRGIALGPLSESAGRLRAWSVSDDPGPGPSETRLPFVGRTREVAVLSALLTSCSACSLGQLIVIRGEAGIGKTRLVEQALSLAEREGFRVHRAAALDFGGQHERNVVTQLTRGLLRGRNLKDTPSASFDEVLALGEPLKSHDRGLILELAGLEYAAPTEAAELSVREAREERQRQLWVELWRGELGHGPSLVAIEDVHWADTAALDQVADLLALTESLPLLLLISTRPDAPIESPRWQGALRGRAATSLDLGPLNHAEGKQLAQELTITDADQVEAAYERSGGHPLFLEQLLRARRPIQLSESIQAVVQTRLDQLTPAEAAALRAAAVLGQQFEASTLCEVMEGDVPAEGLLRSGLVRRVGSKLLFSHSLIRDAVYETLLPTQQRSLHARAARAVKHADRALAAQRGIL